MADDLSDSNDTQITIRLPVSLLSAIQERKARLRDASRGVNVTTSDTIRSLLLAGLSSAGDAR